MFCAAEPHPYVRVRCLASRGSVTGTNRIVAAAQELPRVRRERRERPHSQSISEHGRGTRVYAARLPEDDQRPDPAPARSYPPGQAASGGRRRALRSHAGGRSLRGDDAAGASDSEPGTQGCHASGRVTRNVCTLVDAPQLKHREVEPLSLAEARRVLDAAAGLRNGGAGGRWLWRSACGRAKPSACSGAT